MNNEEIISNVIDTYHDFQNKITYVPRELVKQIVEKVISEDRIAIKVETDNNVSFGIARTLTDKHQANLPGLHIDGGNIVYVDFVYASEKGSIAYLMNEMLDRFDNIEFIAFHRKAKENSSLKIYELDKIHKLTKLIGH